MPTDDAGVVVYYNPACGGALFRLYFALAPEGCGSFGTSPDDAKGTLRSVRQSFARAGSEMRRILVADADERVAEILQAGGRIQIDAQ